jgi:hypothetical protein
MKRAGLPSRSERKITKKKMAAAAEGAARAQPQRQPSPAMMRVRHQAVLGGVEVLVAERGVLLRAPGGSEDDEREQKRRRFAWLWLVLRDSLERCADLPNKAGAEAKLFSCLSAAELNVDKVIQLATPSRADSASFDFNLMSMLYEKMELPVLLWDFQRTEIEEVDIQGGVGMGGGASEWTATLPRVRLCPNPKASELLCAPDSGTYSSPGNPFAWYSIYAHAGTSERVQRHIRSLINGEGVVVTAERFVGRDGSEFDAIETRQLAYNPDGLPSSITVFVQRIDAEVPLIAEDLKQDS